MLRHDLDKMQRRAWRLQFELHNQPCAHEFAAAGARMGWRNRADVPEAARAYQYRKQCAAAAHIRARVPGAVVTLNGREFRGQA